MKRIIVLLILSILVCNNSVAKIDGLAQGEKIPNIFYSKGPCVKNVGITNSFQSLTELDFKLIGDSLEIQGKIEANCCGVHFLSYKIEKDSIYLFRLDSGDLCDCKCPYEINIKIGNCTKDNYTVCLATYKEQDKWEIITAVTKKSFVNLSDINTLHIYPNPSKEYITISEGNAGDKFEIVNIEGKTFANLSIDNYPYQYSITQLPKGIYYIVNRTSNKDLGKFVKE